MKKILFVLAAAFCLASAASAGNIPVRSFRHSGLFPARTPFLVDSVDVKSKAFDPAALLDTPLAGAGISESEPCTAASLPAAGDAWSMGRISFALENQLFTKAGIKVEALEHYRISVDGKKAAGTVDLAPGTHRVDIDYVVAPGQKPAPEISVETADESRIAVRDDGRHRYGMKDVLLGRRIAGVELSPDGKWQITSYTDTREGGAVQRSWRVTETATGRIVAETAGRIFWMPVSNKYCFTENGSAGLCLIAVDPATGGREVFAEGIPQGMFEIAPSEDYLLYHLSEDGPAEKEDIYQILTPDDRQPGWRSRTYPARYDIATGLLQRIAFGYHNCWMADISADGRKGLMLVSEERLEKRPTTVNTLYLIDMETFEAEKLVERDGFLSGASFSPDGQQILLTGSPEALGGIGMKVRKGQTPNMVETELFLMEFPSRKVRPLTRDFDPNVTGSRWSAFDGQVYLTAENRDRIDLFRLDPRKGRISRIETPEDLVSGFSLAAGSPDIAWFGQGASNSHRRYLLDAGSGKSRLVEDLSAEILKDVTLGECREWNFKNSKGETVYGRFYLPPDFDPSRKYPMIVNYYGGCSPTSRTFESRYPHHAYAALGYVVYVVAVPSGATGNGQEWSARHVNTAGDGPAQDIIEGTERFCREHPFVNTAKIGCIGASYGGFMSQYLPTLTDIFACSVSHAGISDHTSYWGFGYWGYSYSETSMAGSYPWSDRELYVDHSPLYLADRINTPILLIHGDADTNVPFNESIQLFTALKLLGKETALVAVKGQNHHILDYSKRLEWQNTIWAWFARWLQDDPSWWDALYPAKSL